MGERTVTSYIPPSSLLSAAHLLRTEAKRLREQNSYLLPVNRNKATDFDLLADELENR